MPRHPSAEKKEIIADTRRRLLEAAVSEFATRGFAGANINRISTAAGFAKGTIYNYFSSKRALMLALVEEIAADHTRFIQSQVVQEVDPVQRIQRFFSAGFEFVEQFPDKAQVSINAVFGHDSEFKAGIFDAYVDLFMMITADILENGIERGDVRRVDADMTTALLMSLYLGSCSLTGPDGKMWLDPGTVVSFIMEGLGRPNGHRQQYESESPSVTERDDKWKQW
jgi:AcrR family transcriptional regulator